MFKKILIANRGEIAVRIIRACRDMGIKTVALFEEIDQGSLHVRLAAECVPLKSKLGYFDQAEILAIAQQTGCQAIHPGYGFLAEQADFARACKQANIQFIGPPAIVIKALRNKIATLNKIKAAGFNTPIFSNRTYGKDDLELMRADAAEIGYPLVIKSAIGGRGRGERLISSPNKLETIVKKAQTEAQAVYGDSPLYLEQIITPAHQLVVQILADDEGNIIHLGEREGSIQLGNQKLIIESPAPCLTESQRSELCQTAINIAKLVGYRNAGSVEFLMDTNGQLYFTEIKARIQMEHAITEMVSGVDIVRQQIRLAAAATLSLTQQDVKLRGWAMQCRINAQDPWNNFLPSPGTLERFRLMGGPHIRVDTYGYSGCKVPVQYDPILAKLIVWDENRAYCLHRTRRALQEFLITGIKTNLPLHQHILDHPAFIKGEYTTDFLRKTPLKTSGREANLQDLAVAAAIAYARRTQAIKPVIPDRLKTGWHRASRKLPT